MLTESLDIFRNDDQTTIAKKAKALQLIGTLIQCALFQEVGVKNEDAACTNAGDKDTLTQFANVFLQVTGARSEAKQAGRVDSLILGLAYYRYRANVAQLLSAKTQAKITILDDQRDAILRELSHLADAKQALSSTDALSVYVAAWSSGRYPARISKLRGTAMERDYAAAVEELGAKFSHASLKPLMDQLVAYGRGGVKPDEILKALQAVGLFAISAN